MAPAIGGWVGDRVLGTRRTMLLGAVVLAIGYGLMVVPGDNVWFLFCSLGVIVVGNGLFKANTGNLVRKIYEVTIRGSTAPSPSTTWRSTWAR